MQDSPIDKVLPDCPSCSYPLTALGNGRWACDNGCEMAFGNEDLKAEEVPAPDETWQAWYYASFDLAREKIRDLLEAAETPVSDDMQVRILGVLDDYANMYPEIEPNFVASSNAPRSESSTEVVVRLEAEIVRLRNQVAFTLTDASRMLRRQDVEDVCPHPDDCFDYGDRVRCGPCAVKASAARGVEIDDTYSHLPEVCRLRRELKVSAARIAELEASSGTVEMPTGSSARIARALEWRERKGRPSLYDEWTADTPLGTYRVVATPDGFAMYLDGRTGTDKRKSLEEAKAAAQDDFEARVRSMVDPEASNATKHATGAKP